MTKQPPIKSYKDKTVSDITSEMTVLSADELEQVRQWEKEHEGRKTILERIDELMESKTLPLAEYRSMNAEAIRSALDDLSKDELREIRRFEKAHENRKTILEEIDDRL